MRQIADSSSIIANPPGRELQHFRSAGKSKEEAERAIATVSSRAA